MKPVLVSVEVVNRNGDVRQKELEVSVDPHLDGQCLDLGFATGAALTAGSNVLLPLAELDRVFRAAAFEGVE